MPSFERMRSICRRSAGTVWPWLSAFSLISSPLTRMMPLVGFSRQLMQRSSVDLPEPRAADDGDHVAVARRQRHALQHMQLRRISCAGSRCGWLRRRRRRRLRQSRQRRAMRSCRPLRAAGRVSLRTFDSSPCHDSNPTRGRMDRAGLPPSTAPSVGPCGASRQMVIGDRASRCEGGEMNIQAGKVVRLAVDGGAAEARADALGRKRHARAPSRREWHYGPGFDPARAAAQHEALRRAGRRIRRRDRMADRRR